MRQEPLAERMRPRVLDEVVGQQHLLGRGRLLRKMIEADQVRPLILYGPPGTGKTTLVRVIANMTKRPFASINAVSAGVKEIREAIQMGRWQSVILHVDEVHRLRKDQAEVLLPAVEDGTVIFIGTSTENPYLEVPPALRSRSTIMELKPLSPADITTALERALADEERGLGAYTAVIDPAVIGELAGSVGGDLRAALTALELAVTTAASGPEGRVITREALWEALRQELHSFSKSDGYDCLSGLQKSVRGSDPDAALHYLARLVSVKFDLETICRRVIVMAAEDVGNAYPQATAIAVAAAQAAQMVGYPEGRIPLAQAVTFLAACPKSNAAYAGLAKALGDVEAGKGLQVPVHLRDASYKGAGALGRGVEYRYPHDYPGNWVQQQYLPDDLVGTRYYEPTENGSEKAIREKLERIRPGRTPPPE